MTVGRTRTHSYVRLLYNAYIVHLLLEMFFSQMLSNTWLSPRCGTIYSKKLFRHIMITCNTRLVLSVCTGGIVLLIWTSSARGHGALKLGAGFRSERFGYSGRWEGYFREIGLQECGWMLSIRVTTVTGAALNKCIHRNDINGQPYSCRYARYGGAPTEYISIFIKT